MPVLSVPEQVVETSDIRLLLVCCHRTPSLAGGRRSMVQPLLASSGSGYGTSSLDQDAAQLDQLAQHLKSAFNSQVGALTFARGIQFCMSDGWKQPHTVESRLTLSSLTAPPGPASKPAPRRCPATWHVLTAAHRCTRRA